MATALAVISCALIVFGGNGAKALELRFTSDPPTLSIQQSVYRINASDTLEITCRGQQYLEWTTPFNRSHVGGRMSLSDCSGAGLFCSSLVLTAATANETGLYRCSFKHQPAEDGKTSASQISGVYQFFLISDYKVPFVRSSQPYEVVFIREGEQVVIPCLGSVEDLNVTLYMKYPPKELIPEGKKVYWDSTRGFVVPSHLISFAGLVYCQTNILNETFQSSLYLIAVVGYKIYDLSVSPVHERLSVGERLVLNCTAHTELNVVLDYTWRFPQGQKKMWNSLEISNMFIIENVTVNDTGEYVCEASSGGMTKTGSTSLTVYEKPFIVLYDPWVNTVEVNVKDGVAKIPVKYFAYPEPLVRWYKNEQLIRKEENYRMKPSKDSLTIYNIEERDSGNYTVVMTNKITREEQRQTFILQVNVPPQIFEKEVAMNADVHMYGSSPSLRCTSRGGSSPVYIRWQWMAKEDSSVQPSCTEWRDISNNTGVNHITVCLFVSLKTISMLKIQKAEDHALYKCIASNKVGMDEHVIVFHVTRGLELRVHPTAQPMVQENVLLKCKADRLLYGNLGWFRVQNVTNPSSVVPCQNLALPRFPLRQAVLTGLQGPNVSLELPLTNTSHQDEGFYACQVEDLHNNERTCPSLFSLSSALESVKILSNLTDQRVNVSETTTMNCDVTGIPPPTVVWSKSNHTIKEGSGVILTRSNHTLTIQRVKKEDGGLYTCTACNSQGCETDEAFLSVEAEDTMNVELIVPIGAVVVAIFFWLLIVFVIRSRKQANDIDLKAGYLSMILDSEDMPMDEQCERLTYDANKWEFPRDRLKLGEPLGRGAFGQVVEASAFGIEKATTCTTVAVKMLKEGATANEYRALMSELKILIHIGHHLNVVNLLGACTKPGGPLMVIVEYCKYGNLSSYLKSKRAEYSPFKVNGAIPTDTRLDICTGTATISRTGGKESVSHLEDGDGTFNLYWDHLTLEDLISYSFQVAKGMEFLSSRKCIHRDLAARNILLSENNVVKICDFGLARDVYKDPDYVRKGDARLPLKWMAPETIFDRVYTTQSDVWSFGILLWEIFSLGASPYPGVSIDEAFCRRLKEGTRMRAPDYATPEIYQTMLNCWLDRPTDRPTFAELVDHLGNLLQASAHQDGKDYIPLTSGEQELRLGPSHTRAPLNRATKEESTDTQLHYDNTFKFSPFPYLWPQAGQSDREAGLSPDEMKNTEPQQFRAPTFSKESLASESSIQTSGYQSGYHSDDADAPIYANEEMILKRDASTAIKMPLPKRNDKFSVEVRYSTPPV
uniref:receptor protein-tyrosine kinase n=1 Tax=Denticeps clupeoides TaxID=299321 RepID=A0AAY4DEX9_9TELE